MLIDIARIGMHETYLLLDFVVESFISLLALDMAIATTGRRKDATLPFLELRRRHL